MQVVISRLTRINHDSPYTKENPIRKIDNIQNVTYPKAGYCGQICISMLTGLDVDEKEIILPDCCIVNVHAGQTSHFVLYYKGKYYDSTDINADKIIGYLTIIVE